MDGNSDTEVPSSIEPSYSDSSVASIGSDDETRESGATESPQQHAIFKARPQVHIPTSPARRVALGTPSRLVSIERLNEAERQAEEEEIVRKENENRPHLFFLSPRVAGNLIEGEENS